MFEVAGFGNALLDITVAIQTTELLSKHNLKEDDQKEIAVSDLESLYLDISKFPKRMSPGGCAQNTLRVLQWLLNEPNKTVFFGAVGDDEQGKILTKLVNDVGVCTKYKINKNHHTGQCISLAHGINRSLVANLGAAEMLNLSNLMNTETTNILKAIKIIYLEGFFLTNRLEVAYYVRDFALSNKIVLAFNLCGEYLCNSHPSNVRELADSAHLVFGNANEFLSLGKAYNMSDLKGIALALNAATIYKENPLLRFGKVVVITNGSDPLLCVHGNGAILQLTVPALPDAKIQDTTGAGDSFVSGFLAGILRNYTLRQCLELGCWSSSCIIQEIGCTVPQYPANLSRFDK